MARRFIPAYFDWLESLSACTDEELGKLLRALLSYGRDGVNPSFPDDGRLALAWGLLKAQLIASTEIYAKRSTSGKNGASKRWEQPPVTAEDVNDTRAFLDELMERT